MKIRVKIDSIEIELHDADSHTGYPRIVSTDPYKNITKSERLIEVVKELTNEAVKVYNETFKL
jgi:hypothetical protein